MRFLRYPAFRTYFSPLALATACQLFMGARNRQEGHRVPEHFGVQPVELGPPGGGPVAVVRPVSILRAVGGGGVVLPVAVLCCRTPEGGLLEATRLFLSLCTCSSGRCWCISAGSCTGMNCLWNVINVRLYFEMVAYQVLSEGRSCCCSAL